MAVFSVLFAYDWHLVHIDHVTNTESK